MKIQLSLLTALCGALLGGVPSALADDPGVGDANADHYYVSLGDSHRLSFREQRPEPSLTASGDGPRNLPPAVIFEYSGPTRCLLPPCMRLCTLISVADQPRRFPGTLRGIASPCGLRRCFP